MATADESAKAAKTIILESSDEQRFTVDREIAVQSVTIRNMLEDLDDVEAPLVLPNVKGETLARVIEYLQYHQAHPSQSASTVSHSTDKINSWDMDFCKVDNPHLFELILTANYLDIKPLLDVTCKTVANMIKGMSPEQIRQVFNIKNDFTPEEEEQIHRENAWLEEDDPPIQIGGGAAEEHSITLT